MIQHALQIAVFLLLVGPAGAAEKQKPTVIPDGGTVVGRCVGVHDGDSITLLSDTPAGPRQSKIRLDAIGAPELGQPFSNRSKQTLSGMVFEKECSVESLGPDKYGCTISRLTGGGKDVDAVMLEAGMAWDFNKYDDRQSMAARQEAAHKGGAGLWADPHPMAPGEWRKMSKERTKARLETAK